MVINGLTGLSLKETSENKRDCQWLRPTITSPPYILQPKFSNMKEESPDRSSAPNIILTDSDAKLLLRHNRAEVEVPSMSL